MSAAPSPSPAAEATADFSCGHPSPHVQHSQSPIIPTNPPSPLHPALIPAPPPQLMTPLPLVLSPPPLLLPLSLCISVSLISPASWSEQRREEEGTRAWFLKLGILCLRALRKRALVSPASRQVAVLSAVVVCGADGTLLSPSNEPVVCRGVFTCVCDELWGEQHRRFDDPYIG